MSQKLTLELATEEDVVVIANMCEAAVNVHPDTIIIEQQVQFGRRVTHKSKCIKKIRTTYFFIFFFL
jgi:hypothetical protein